MALDQSERLRVTFASDIGGINGIHAMDRSEVRDHAIAPMRHVGSLGWQSGLIRLLRRRRYDDVVMLGDAKYLSTWVSAIFARARGMRVYFWTIGWHRPEQGLKRIIRLAFYRLAHGLLLYGRTGAAIGESVGYPRSRMHVIGNSVEASDRVESRPEIALSTLPQGRICVGAVIRLTAVKRLDLLLAAASVLQAKGHAVVVLLVGEGPESERLARTARELGVELHLPGSAYSLSDLTKIYESIDVTVVPAAVGLTAIQSMNFGTPVVSDDDAFSQMPEWEAIVPGVTGELYRAGDVVELADAILRAYARVKVSQRDVAEACRAEVRSNWSANGQAEKIVNVLYEQAG